MAQNDDLGQATGLVGALPPIAGCGSSTYTMSGPWHLQTIERHHPTLKSSMATFLGIDPAIVNNIASVVSADGCEVTTRFFFDADLSDRTNTPTFDSQWMTHVQNTDP